MLYYLYGTGWMRGKLCVDNLRLEHAGARFMHFDLERQWNEFCDAVQAEVRSHNLFGGDVILVGKTEKLSKDQIKTLQLLDSDNGNTTLVIWELSTKPSWKPKTKRIVIKEFNELSLAGARNWVADYIKDRKLSVSKEVVEMLIEIFGSKIDFIVQELEKYATLHASSVPVGNSQGIFAWESGERNFFEWIRSVLEQDVSGIDRYAPSQEQFMQYLTGLINAVRTVILSRGKTRNGDVNPFWAKKLMHWSSGKTDDQLQKLFSLLLELDLDIRGGKVDMGQVVLDLKTRLITVK